ncbi:MAG: hypothetical protein GXO12_01490 [Epsilonproteobacteria bacterium]|nr:hypothetical protein [Campylobacterota bacterium]
MILDIMIFIHILAASAWIGGSILLFGMGLYFKDKDVQTTVYYYIGPFYGYFEMIVLTFLLVTGGYFIYAFSIGEILMHPDVPLAKYLFVKIILVLLITFSTAVHMYISLNAHGRERSMKEKYISRATSLAIFFLNLGILWYAIKIRSLI